MFELLFASQAPIVLFFSYLYLRDKGGREPIWLLIKTTLLGAAVGLPVIGVEFLFQDLTSLGEDSAGFGLFFYAVIGIALVEETGKFLVLRFYNYRKVDFNEPYDGIMYSGAVSLGFAALENLLYVGSYGHGIAVVRAFTAVPMHAMTACIMGYYVGNAKFGDPKVSLRECMKGLMIAVLIHGVYDYFAFARSALLFTVLFVELRLALKAIRMHRERAMPY